MKKLDFIIIGAQKSATTSLYKYLKPHPQIFMSSNKEAPYFSRDEMYAAGWESFVVEYFEGAKHDQFWGTASPQYMGDGRAAERIHELMPDTRLIAILRNPIERAYSHYTMQARRDLEKRSFDQAVSDLLDPEALRNSRAHMPLPIDGCSDEDETGHYLVWGEYGRILQDFLKYFPKEQLLVLYMDDLMNDPKTVYRQVIDFIGIDDDGQVPANVGKVYHKGGSERIIPDSWRLALKENGLFKFFWGLFPEFMKKRLRVFYDHHNLKRNTKSEGPSSWVKKQLVDHFASDIELLQSITGNSVPWKEFASTEKEVPSVEKETIKYREIRAQS